MSVIITHSLGAGVQSSAMALMAANYELPMPAAAIFADTGDEPKSVYDWLNWLEEELPFPVIRAMRRGNPKLSEKSTHLRTAKTTGNTYLSPSIPVFTLTKGKKGMLPRHCTRDFKIDVVRAATKAVMKEHGTTKSLQALGISTDEAHRMKPSRDAKIEYNWPLIDLGISRQDCLTWMENQGYPRPPRSACVFCPYHNDQEWVRLRDEEPEAFDRAVVYEEQLRAVVKESTSLKADDVFLHRSRVPLLDVQFDEGDALNQFGNECEGMCGV